MKHAIQSNNAGLKIDPFGHNKCFTKYIKNSANFKYQFLKINPTVMIGETTNQNKNWYLQGSPLSQLDLVRAKRRIKCVTLVKKKKEACGNKTP